MASRSSAPPFLYSPRTARADRVSSARGVVLALAALAVSSPWHQRPFLTRPDLPLAHPWQSAPVRTAARLDSIWRAASQLQAGDVVEITDDAVEGWHDAIVDRWDGDSKLKVHYRQEGYDYHCLARAWRVPIETSEPPESPKLPKLTVAELQRGQKLRARVVKVADNGLRLDVGAEMPAFVHKSGLPADLLDSGAVGREVDVWFLFRGRHTLQCHMQDIKSLRGLVGQNFPIEVLYPCEEGVWVVLAEVPNGSVHAKLFQHDAEVGSKFEARLADVDLRMGLVRFNPLADPEDIAAFEGVSDEQWLPAIVEARSPRYITIRVWPPTDGSSARTGFVEVEDLVEDTFCKTTAEVVEVGQALGVRRVRSDIDDGLLRFTMTDKVDFSAFDGLPASAYLNATITDIGPAGALLRVPPPGGGLPARGFLSRVSVDAKVGQQIPVRVRGLSNRSGALDLTDAGFAYFADLPRDQWIEGTVGNVVTFGAFVTVTPPGGMPVQGLLHRSNLKGSRQVLKTGEAVRVRVTTVDVEAGRLGLTVLEPEAV